MAVNVKPYCTIDDLKTELPILIGETVGSTNVPLTGPQYESIFLSVSADIDGRLILAGYSTPIEYGAPGDSDYNMIAHEIIKRVAILGAAGRIQRAIKKERLDYEPNYLEKAYSVELAKIIEKGFPTIKKAVNYSRGPIVGTWKDEEWFTEDGFNDAYPTTG